MEKIRADIKIVLDEYCKEWRIEDGIAPQSLEIFVDDDKVEEINRMLKVCLPSFYRFQVSSITGEPAVEKPEVVEMDVHPLNSMAKLLDIPLEKKEDGELVYLEEVTIGHTIAAAKYSKTKPGSASDLLGMLGKMMHDRNKPRPNCNCANCTKLRESSSVPNDGQVH